MPAETQISKLDEKKVRQLMQQYILLQKEKELLEIRLKQKDDDLIDAHAQIAELRRNNVDLMLARTLGVTDEERRAANRRLTQMMREIDKCIALLIN